MATSKRSEPPPFAPTPGVKTDLTFEKGLPCDIMAEQFVLGSVLLNSDLADTVLAILPEDFSLEKHRRIFARMQDLRARGEAIDRVTIANELRRQGQLESVDGFSYLVSLDEGLPSVSNLDSYIRIVREKANLRRIIFQSQKMIDAAFIGEQTPAELLASATATWHEIESNSGQNDDGGQTPRQIAETFPGGIDALLNPLLRKKGLPTGFTKFDEMTGGLHAGEVVVIAARPSHGKSAWSMNVAQHLVLHPRQKRRVVFFSLEMSKESIMTRLLCSAGRVDQMKFRNGYLNSEDRRKIQIALGDLTADDLLTIYDISGITMPEITKRIRRLYNDTGLDLVIIDYIGLIGLHGRSENRNQEMANMSRQFKMLASELQIPFIILSQLNRSVETRRGSFRPMLSDLRDSGAIEQDADVVAFIFREELYKKDRDDLHGLADLIIAKQRNGPLATIPLRFLGNFVRFENRAEDLPEQES